VSRSESTSNPLSLCVGWRVVVRESGGGSSNSSRTASEAEDIVDDDVLETER
jgi:hypothetical protein